MSNINCEACSELRENAPEFVQNGVTDTVCTSLKNDTGFNPNLTSTHTDCEDLDLANDCLVGRMDQELEAYDVCDWKKFMHKFIPNLWELLKGFICSLCGAWIKIHDHDDAIEELCIKVDNTMSPATVPYGVTPYNDTHPERIIGHLGEKDGQPLIIIPPREEANPYFYDSTGIGIGYVKKRFRNCTDGACREYEWLVAHIYDVSLSSAAENGDILWYATKAEVQAATGFSDYLWDAFTISSWTWVDFGLTDHRYAWVEITIDENRMGADYLTVVYRGTSYPNTGLGATMRVSNIDRGEARVYAHHC